MQTSKKIKFGYFGGLILAVICFITFSSEASAQNSATEPIVLSVVDELPIPPGGMEAMHAYFNKNMRYPELAKEKGTEGTVVATFNVQIDGSLTDIELLRGIGDYCDEEAIRLIKTLDRWQPGKVKGEPVVTRMRIPVRFML